MAPSRGVLVARNLTVSYGDTRVLDALSLTVNPGDRIGLVGPNGIGKSTLLATLAGTIAPERGSVRREPAALVVAHLAQTLLCDGGSPGQAARAALSRIGAAKADLLLLDEPTNNLDEDGLCLLERLLREHAGGLVAASHDRAFLEHMTAILEFEPETRRIRRFAGGWSEFEHSRAAGRLRDQAAYTAHRAGLERFEQQARRMRSWQQQGYGQGRKKKKTRDVAKAIEQRRARIGTVEKPWSAWQLQMSFEGSPRGGDAVVALERAVIERHGFRLGPIDLALSAGERVTVTGPNGAGKSTLLAGLLGQAPLLAGTRRVGPATVFSSLPQVGGALAGEEPLIDAFLELGGQPVEQARALLAKFGLGANHVARACRSLTPGERTRAALAGVVASKANALILDEPTNNLDIEAIEQLESALAGYQGTLVLVSHDRRLLERLEVHRSLRLGSGGRLAD